MTEALKGRDEKGLFAPGNKIGQGRTRSVFQDYTPRAAYFLQTLTTAQILGLSVDLEKLDKDYSSFDGMVLRHLGNMLRKGNDEFAAQERERLMDRTTGKPKQALTGGDEDDAPIRLLTNSDADIIARYNALQAKPEGTK